jgi:outer membrane protein OmpA-like peptidoglycan-associated protein
MNRFARRSLSLAAAAALLASLAYGEKDADGKDYPMFNRMPGYYITSYKEMPFDAVKFRVQENGKQAETTVEGHVWDITYEPDTKLTPPATKLQILRNFTNAIKKAGGQVLFELGPDAGGDAGLTLRVVKGGKEVWVNVNPWATGRYDLRIVQKEAMKQDVVADAAAWEKDIHENGKVAVYGLFFDNGKSDLKSSAAPVLAQIVKLLKQSPDMKFYVVGHTDMTGDASANVELSNARARAVIHALVDQYGVAAERLKSFGAGPYSPVSSNRDEDGRAQNRRVELVEIPAAP